MAAFLTTLANILVTGVNGLWKMLIFLWLSIQEWFAALYTLLAGLADIIPLLSQALSLIWFAVGVVLGILGSVLSILGQLGGVVLGILGWIIGMSSEMIRSILVALNATTVPPQLTESYVVYSGLRGMLEGVRDSDAGWALYLFWALCYIGAVFWLSRFFAGSKAD